MVTYFDVSFGSLDLYNETNAPAYGFTQFLFLNVPGEVDSTTLQFTFRQDPAYYRLDDVVVVASTDASIYSPCDSASGNLVANCGFETGDFTGWTQFGNPGGLVGSDVDPTSGSYLALFGQVGDTGGISQAVGPTSSSTFYDISFYLENDGGGETMPEQGTPEPGTLDLWLSGLGGLGLLLRCQRS